MSRPPAKTSRRIQGPGYSPGPSTLCVHGGKDAEAHGASLVIDPSSVYAFRNFEESLKAFEGPGRGYIYSRYEHPTCRAVERRLAALEQAEDSVLFSSGLSVLTACVQGYSKTGDHVLASEELYGGTSTLLKALAGSMGIEVEFASRSSLQRAGDLVKENTRLILVESPSNPLAGLVDFAAFFNSLGEQRPITLLDGTFATPLSQSGLALGFDLVMHSATKYLGGHDDLLAGVVSGPEAKLTPLRDLRRQQGAMIDANTAWLLERGLKTLALRWERQCANALALAAWLDTHPKVARVHYPGLPSHPDHDLAARQMRSYGAIVAFEVSGGLKHARRTFDGLQLIARAPSLGGVESAVLHPATSSHRDLSPQQRSNLGIADGLLRISAGIEDLEDLRADLDQALA